MSIRFDPELLADATLFADESEPQLDEWSSVLDEFDAVADLGLADGGWADGRID